MRNKDGSIPKPEIRLDYATRKLVHHIGHGYLNNAMRTQLKKWAIDAAHAVFEMHPDLREEGSLLRYFVAKEGRKQGLRGAALTAFVEAEYQAGTWWRLVPDPVLRGEPKVA